MNKNKATILSLAAAAMLILGLGLWAAISTLGYLWEQAPQWLEDSTQLATEVVEKADRALPGLKQKAEQIAPELTEQVEALLPGKGVPKQDVGGEDIPGIPRYPGLMRTTYTIERGYRTLSYRGAVSFREVLDFYRQQLTNIGYSATVISATTLEETHEYSRGEQRLRLVVREHTRLGDNIIEVQFTEIQKE